MRITLGEALTALDQPEQARRELESALEAMIHHGSTSGQAKAWEAIGAFSEHCGHCGHTDGATHAYTTALGLLSSADPTHRRISEHLERLASP